MWQFMPHGDYGLSRNLYVDERFDPEKSTRAYARYIKFLYNQLGDWYLAMAAYNWGAGNVQRAVQKTGYADFWELYKRHYSVELRLVSDLVGAPADELEARNPSLLRMVTPPEAPFDLHLPAGTATLFEQRIALIPEARRGSWRYHSVEAGDTLASVAREYRVQPAELAAANQLKESDSLEGVEALVIPVPPAAAPSTRMVLYTARRGDTLVTIADRFGVSLAQLRRWNSVTGTRVEPGRRLHIAEPTLVRRASRSRRGSASAAAAKAGSSAPVRRSGVNAPPAPGRNEARTARKATPRAKHSKRNPARHSQTASQ